MALACGVAVANIYYNQPLLALLQSDFRSSQAVRFVPTATQLGYAVGLLLLVPLGDRMERRSLITGQMLALCVAVGCAALSPSGWILAVASVAVGIAASVAQQIVPFAAELSEPGRRGVSVGYVMSGLLSGILLGRTVAGLIGKHFGWRAMFALATVLTAGAAVLVFARLPKYKSQSKASYGELLGSLATIARQEPALLRAAAVQAALFASFSVFWTILALQLEYRYRMGSDVAGLFGLLGMVGILIAPIAGRAADSRGPQLVIRLCGLMMLLSWVAFGLWNSMLGLIVGVILLDFGQQGSLVSNQHIIYSLRPEARNRMNTIFMVGMFLGGAAGSAVASVAWQAGGWNKVSMLGGGLAALSLLVQRLWNAAPRAHTIS